MRIQMLSKAALRDGWIVFGKKIHPLHAYTSGTNWMRDFEAAFPKKAKKMKEYSKKKNWAGFIHDARWLDVCLNWLDKNCD